MDQEILELCTKKCVQRKDLKNSEDLTLPQKSCFHRCSIKFMEAMRFTQDLLKFQSY